MSELPVLLVCVFSTPGIEVKVKPNNIILSVKTYRPIVPGPGVIIGNSVKPIAFIGDVGVTTEFLYMLMSIRIVAADVGMTVLGN